ncbi:hypothetical protein [Candidatus Endomicrobiellum trichonymphae]|uniref:hypothetical protein n=1 Tax=Endomicrobium trichonymphae TaxID=1408204 RepID=UPI0001718430|nr:hypothetical protein [Candidatus Endomicrobium trichonymphae]
MLNPANKVSAVEVSQGKTLSETVWSVANNPYVLAILMDGVISAVWYLGFYKPVMKKMSDLASVSPTEEEDERSDKSVQNLEKQLEALRFSKNGSEWLATEKTKELKSLEKPVRGISYRFTWFSRQTGNGRGVASSNYQSN